MSAGRCLPVWTMVRVGGGGHETSLNYRVDDAELQPGAPHSLNCCKRPSQLCVIRLPAGGRARSRGVPGQWPQPDGNQWHSWGVGSDSYYDILGVSSAATPDEIKAKYRNLLLRIHPDLDGPAALFRQVQEAYEVLSDPVRRASYDWLLESPSGRVWIPKARWYREPSPDPRSRGALSGSRPGGHKQIRIA